MSITELQRTIWENCAHDSSATQKIRNQALVYYCEYKEHLKEMTLLTHNESKIQNLMLISYFLSQKSQVLFDVKGNRISNIALSINQLVKKHSDYKELFYHMKEMLRTVNLPPQARQSEQQIKSFMKYFSFLMTFYNKYLSTFNKITICHNISEKDLESIGGEKEYFDSVKYLLWVVYVMFRKHVFKNSTDTIANTCLLACLFSYFVSEVYKQEKITAVYSTDIVIDLGTFPNEYQEIEEICLGYFCLSDLKTYSEVRNAFSKFIDNLGIKVSEFKQPFFVRTIQYNIKKLQELYHKDQDINQIDETLFLKNLSNLQSNLRFTAFGANRKVKQFHSNNIFQCKRTLNYDLQAKNCDKTVKKQAVDSEFNSKGYLQVMKKIKISQTPVILIQATPVTQFANAYNWMYKKSLQNAQSGISINLQELLQIGFKEDLFQLKNQQILEKQHLIEGLFYELLSQYSEENQQNINVSSILALEVFSYVMNITNRELSQLVEALNVSWYSVWQGIDILLNYDKTMPHNVKTHLLLMQTSIVSSFIWKQPQFIDSLEQTTLTVKYPDFFYRILHHIAYQLHFICKEMAVPDTLMDQTFIICQYYLKECIQMMENMSLDIVIMCAIYGVCRAKNLDIKFKTIINVYKRVNNIDDKAFEAMQVFQESDKEDFSTIAAIINFYNEKFMPHCKKMLLKVKGQTLKEQFLSYLRDQDINPVSYVLSPVKSILPSSVVSSRTSIGTPGHSQMLAAYNESPLLKRNRTINLNQNYHIECQPTESPNIYAKKLYNESEILRERSSNISQMLQQKFGNQKKSTLIPKSYHPTKP